VPSFVAVFAAVTAADEFDSEGWEEKYLEPLDMSLLMPSGNMRNGDASEVFVNWNHNGSSLGYSLTLGDANQMMRLHEFTLDAAGYGANPYTVRKPNLFVTTVTASGGRTLYTRSDLRRGSWSTIMLSVETKDAGILAAVSGSIHPGDAPEIYFPAGVLSRGWTVIKTNFDAEQAANAPSAPSPSAPSQPTAQEPQLRSGSGTGFVVSTTGDVLTNAHVVEGCTRITIDSIPMTLVASDATFDLALLRGAGLSGQPFASFSANPAMLNSDVTVVGYPLAGLLGGLNVTRGSVTSLKGMSGDTTTMQISAPVQPGNSGGPVLNAKGHIVGVVVSKLDAQIVQDAIGDIPQNVNFAIRGEIAKLFLVQNNVIPVAGTNTDQPAPEQLALGATGFTKFISCE
jgi:serine protease Do